MKTRPILRGLLVLTIFIFSLFGLYRLQPESYAFMELPERVYQAYGVSSEEALGDNSIKFVTVNYDGEIKKFFSRSQNPVTALIDSGYSVSNRNKIVSTSPISTLYDGTYIQVYTYKTTIDEILLDIPYKTILNGEILCRSLAQEVVEQEGVLGVMSQRIKRTYKGDILVAEEIVDETIEREPRPQIIVIRGPQDLPDSVPQRGYACGYWNSYIDNNINATTEEKNWLKFIISCESGCNAESNKSFYKGLFQWNPCLWYKQYPNDNIFDGEVQIKRTLQKLREGTNPNQMWPSCHRAYKSQPGVEELSWLQ
jgi:hypothetical protein